MRIAIDALPFVMGGGETYIVNLVKSLSRIDAENEYLLLIPRDKEALFPIDQSNFSKYVCSLPEKSSYLRVAYRAAWQQFFRTRLIRANGIDVLFVAGISGAVNASCRVVFSLLITAKWFTDKSLRRTVRMRILERLMRASVTRADHVIAASEVAKEDLVSFTGIPSNKVTAIQLGIGPLRGQSPLAEVKQRYGIKGPYMLYVSSLYRHKNHERLLEAYALIQEGIPHQLIIAGGHDNEYSGGLPRAIDRLGLRDQVKICGFVAEADLASLYAGADLFVFPSYLEAGPTPPLEAMIYGCPVVASSIEAVRERCGDAVLYFDPLDVEEIATKMHRVLSDPGLQEELRCRGRDRIKLYAWDQVAAQTLAVIKSVGETRAASDVG